MRNPQPPQRHISTPYTGTPNAGKAGSDIYELLNPAHGKSPHGSGNAQASKSSTIVFYSAREVAAVPSLRYHTALYVMGSHEARSRLREARRKKAPALGKRAASVGLFERQNWINWLF